MLRTLRMLGTLGTLGTLGMQEALVELWILGTLGISEIVEMLKRLEMQVALGILVNLWMWRTPVLSQQVPVLGNIITLSM